MNNSTKTNILLGTVFAVILLIGFGSNTAVAAGPSKVQVCHFPPDNLGNWHTINISPNAVDTHLEEHGDLLGPCNAFCAQLCDDGNACTIDDAGDCQDVGCPTTPVPVDCNDGDACTTDSCDPGSGCSNADVVCTPSDLCHVSVCSNGACMESEIVCAEDETCNPDSGLCEAGPDPECAGQTCANFTTCNAGGSCGSSGVCGSTAEGGGLCVDGATSCGGLTACPNGSSDCSAGDLCFVDSCCGSPVCVPNNRFCSEPVDGVAASTQATTETKEPGTTFGQ
jgi:hypothetical protein